VSLLIQQQQQRETTSTKINNNYRMIVCNNITAMTTGKRKCRAPACGDETTASLSGALNPQNRKLTTAEHFEICISGFSEIRECCAAV